MFKMAVKTWWNGDAAKARLIAEKRAGLKALAEYVADRAWLYCPYDPSKPPGELHLRNTIQVISEASGDRHHVVATAPWAEPVEFGYTHYLSKKRIPPQMYLRRAIRDGANAMPQFIGQARANQGYRTGRLMGATFE